MTDDPTGVLEAAADLGEAGSDGAPEPFALFGTDLFGDAISPMGGLLAKRFTLPPFTVLNARGGDWRERKEAWLRVGIKSELGRDGIPTAAAINTHAGAGRDLAAGQPVAARKRTLAQGLAVSRAEDGTLAYDEMANTAAVSIFDPVLCELAYRWFSAEGDTIIDPFAGGSVRGIVASLLGRHYWGCDLRDEQVEANMEQGEALCPDAYAAGHLRWVAGDSVDVVPHAPDADLVFTCPPYGDLEVYSDDPRDISTMNYDRFMVAYRDIIGKSVARLRPNRFAAVVVGDFRDKGGNTALRGFPTDTILAFREHGMALYNEAVLATSVGSLAVRVTRQFETSRKMGMAHQHLLVFVKGDPRAATRHVMGTA